MCQSRITGFTLLISCILVGSVAGETADRNFEAVSSILDPIVEWKNIFLSSDNSDRPFVLVAYAQSLDGRLAPFLPNSNQETESNYAVSGPESLLMTHAIRSASDAILIGRNTLIKDNPRLNNRLWKISAGQPRPVILDTNLAADKLLTADVRAKNPIICFDESLLQRERQASDREYLPCRTTADGYLDLHDVMRKLRRIFGIQSVMVEGGAKVIKTFLEQKLADALCVTVSPNLVGPGIGLDLNDSMRMEKGSLHSAILGDDWCLVGKPVDDVESKKRT